jgi:lysophospholipase L1-like esterase
MLLTALLCGAVNAQEATVELATGKPSLAVQGWVHPWMQKRVAYFGDSITDPRNDGSKLKYWNFLQDWLGITPYVYAVSGRQWNDIPRQADKLQAEHGDSVDAILIFIGTNDYNNGVPIGEWYDVKSEEVMYGHGQPKQLVNRQRRYMNMDAATYRGRINIALDKVKRMYPTKQIVLLTPIHRAQFYRNEKNWQITEDYTNQCGIYLEEYIQAVKDAGNIWAVPVIDLNSISGLYPMIDEHAQYFKDAATDRLHPNDKGHERIARTLYCQLAALPCGF